MSASWRTSRSIRFWTYASKNRSRRRGSARDVASGSPPRTRRSMYSVRVVPDSCRIPGPSRNAASMNPSPVPSISPCENGHNSMVSMRQGRVSGRSRGPRSRDDPVSRKRPGRGSASTLALIASNRSGTRWISSMTVNPSKDTKPTGSSNADCRCGGRSRSRHSASRSPATARTSVLLPTCRAPLISTTRVSARAADTADVACRGRNGDVGTTPATNPCSFREALLFVLRSPVVASGAGTRGGSIWA